ncbi:hypothetical protein ACFWN7_01925 [Agromyces sp. NPDC058484]|uniref:hypothetical protein n=1 Tax=Agromyces sp. NPDC058484 TaxID=3346524 RepID=UPI0036607606
MVEAMRDLRAARLEDHVTRVLAQEPHLTPEQRVRIAELVAEAPPLDDDQRAVIMAAFNPPRPPAQAVPRGEASADETRAAS